MSPYENRNKLPGQPNIYTYILINKTKVANKIFVALFDTCAYHMCLSITHSALNPLFSGFEMYKKFLTKYKSIT